MNVHDTAKVADAILAADMARTGEDLCRELTKSRQLSKVVRSLNHDVLKGGEGRRDRAIQALTRLGLWAE